MIYLDIKKRTSCTLRLRRPFEIGISKRNDIIIERYLSFTESSNFRMRQARTYYVSQGQIRNDRSTWL